MQCTACKKGKLRPTHLEHKLPAHECHYCQGHWLYLADYLNWLETTEDVEPVNNIEISVDETTKALLCPVTKTIMTKYKIAHDSEHRLDLSSIAHAVWMDKGEWELLKTKGISRELHKVFTAPWQNQIRSKETQQTFTSMYEQDFGDDYLKIKDIKIWLDKHPHKTKILAYFMDSNPYSGSQ